MEQDVYGPVHDMSSDECDLLAAVFEATAHRADILDAGTMDIDVADQVTTQQSSLADMHDPDRAMLSVAPPKRFYRRNWQSFSLRLLHRCTETAKPSKSTRQMSFA